MAGNDNQRKYGLVEICHSINRERFFVKWKTGHQKMVLLAGHMTYLGYPLFSRLFCRSPEMFLGLLVVKYVTSSRTLIAVIRLA